MKRRAAPLDLTTTPVIELLRNADAPVWHDQEAYRALMDRNRWRMPARERFGLPDNPQNRRQAAASGWARDNGVCDLPGHADLHRLRAMGLID